MDKSALKISDHVSQGIETAEVAVPDAKFVELVWPGKGGVQSTEQEPQGTWLLHKRSTDADRHYPFVELSRYPSAAAAPRSMIIRGQRIQALSTLGRALKRFVRMAYLDLPRISVDDSKATFQGDPGVAYSTWLSVVYTHLQAVERLIRRDGVLVLHVGEAEEPYARLIANELFREQHVATIVWQKAYAPQNMKGMREFTATHDCLLVYAKDKACLPPVGLRRPPEGYSNSDKDPRGPWKAEHKGANSFRENSDFNTFVPPYRWEIVEGGLPDGLWRLSPLTGVIWGKPSEIGRFPIKVEVSDKDGKKARRSLVIEILENAPPADPPALPWIFEEIQTTGNLRIETRTLQPGALGVEYSVALIAAGGLPFKEKPKRPGSGRYWEFARNTLLAAYQSDAVYLGAHGPTAIPHPKQYAPPEGEMVIENQQTWWPGRDGTGSNSTAFAGYTEDATKHLKALKELGLIKTAVSVAKPEHLIARLIDIFTEPGDTTLEVFGQVGDLAAAALKRGRNFFSLAGASDRDESLFTECALPRLKAVVDGKDSNLEEQVAEIRMRADAYVPYEGGGSFAIARIGMWFAERRKREELASLNFEHYTRPDMLVEALMTSEGFLPCLDNPFKGLALTGDAIAFVLAPADFLTTELASEIATEAVETKRRAIIYYFRASTDFDATALPNEVTCKRVPFDLGL